MSNRKGRKGRTKKAVKEKAAKEKAPKEKAPKEKAPKEKTIQEDLDEAIVKETELRKALTQADLDEALLRKALAQADLDKALLQKALDNQHRTVVKLWHKRQVQATNVHNAERVGFISSTIPSDNKGSEGWLLDHETFITTSMTLADANTSANIAQCCAEGRMLKWGFHTKMVQRMRASIHEKRSET
jgi:hypothetical protein